LVAEATLNDETISKYGWDTDYAKNFIEKYDIIVPEKRFAGDVRNVYGYAKTQNIKDFDFCFNYVYANYPEMRKAIKKYKHAKWGLFLQYVCYEKRNI